MSLIEKIINNTNNIFLPQRTQRKIRKEHKGISAILAKLFATFAPALSADRVILK